MEYLDEFKEFVNYCNQNGKYVGWGNPNSKILIVGVLRQIWWYFFYCE